MYSYANYLEAIVRAYGIEIQEEIHVEDFEIESNGIKILKASEGAIRCRVLISAVVTR